MNDELTQLDMAADAEGQDTDVTDDAELVAGKKKEDGGDGIIAILIG